MICMIYFRFLFFEICSSNLNVSVSRSYNKCETVRFSYVPQTLRIHYMVESYPEQKQPMYLFACDYIWLRRVWHQYMGGFGVFFCSKKLRFSFRPRNVSDWISQKNVRSADTLETTSHLFYFQPWISYHFLSLHWRSMQIENNDFRQSTHRGGSLSLWRLMSRSNKKTHRKLGFGSQHLDSSTFPIRSNRD